MASKPMFPSISPTPRGAGRYQQTLEKKQRSRRSLHNSPAHARGRRYGVRAGRDDAPHGPFIPGFPPCGARRRNLPRPDDVSGLLHSRLQQPRQGPPRPNQRRVGPTLRLGSRCHRRWTITRTLAGNKQMIGAFPRAPQPGASREAFAQETTWSSNSRRIFPLPRPTSTRLRVRRYTDLLDPREPHPLASRCVRDNASTVEKISTPLSSYTPRLAVDDGIPRESRSHGRILGVGCGKRYLGIQRF
ncbi:hypothetical protein B296_00001637 [Ensete ventricosum]|uniref:Uncharacterized protein n=1 Tax=Ensete ventricosum TaxID=4639 RepID=A0A427B528_ENSVE|nr:hypothetical protein B296_00001637 [Ensete ventricosum]